jgi:hypothetical protein
MPVTDTPEFDLSPAIEGLDAQTTKRLFYSWRKREVMCYQKQYFRALDTGSFL